MKKNIIISVILGTIALFCALLIALVNMVTSPTIDTNNKQKELDTCQAIFEAYDSGESEELDISNADSRITKKILAKDSSGTTIGYLYTVSGKNAYGIITLMVAIKDDSVYQVEFLENGQSFSQNVENHVKNQYPSSETSDIHVGFYDDSQSEVGSLSIDDVKELDLNNSDVTCGATFGAKLVQQLVLVALTDTRGA